jgi:hypothetical protein
MVRGGPQEYVLNTHWKRNTLGSPGLVHELTLLSRSRNWMAGRPMYHRGVDGIRVEVRDRIRCLLVDVRRHPWARLPITRYVVEHIWIGRREHGHRRGGRQRMVALGSNSIQFIVPFSITLRLLHLLEIGSRRGGISRAFRIRRRRRCAVVMGCMFVGARTRGGRSPCFDL